MAWRLLPRRRLLRVLMWAGVAATALFVVLVLAAAVVNGDTLRGPLERAASERFGRPVQIQRGLAFAWHGLTATVRVEGLVIGNPRWAGAAAMARADRVTADVRLLPLLTGRVVLPSLTIVRPELHLIRDEQGRANWALTPDGRPRNGRAPHLPLIQRLEMTAGQLSFQDLKRELDLRGVMSASEPAAGPAGRPFTLLVLGTMNDEPFRMQVRGPALDTVRPDTPYAFESDIVAASTHVVARGQMLKPFDLGLLQADFDARGNDMAELYYLNGLAFPNTQPYHLAGRFTRHHSRVRFDDISGNVGESDMHGNVNVELAGVRPLVRAEVSSKSLNLDDALTWFRGSSVARKAAKAAGEPHEAQAQPPSNAKPDMVFPDAKLQAARLRAMDAQVSYRAAGVKSARFPVSALTMALSLEEGVMKAEPVSLALPAGHIEATVVLDARRDLARTTLDAKLAGIELSQFKAKATRQAPFGGQLRGRVKLAGPGNSVHEFVSGSTGTVTLVVPHGEVREALAELAGVNVARGLGLLLKDDEETTRVRCGVADLEARQGTLEVQNLVFDTNEVLITGRGGIQLGTEQYDLSLKGQPKKVRLLRVKSRVSVRGPLRHPSLGVEPSGSALGQAGAAVALGALVTPLAAIVMFVDPGLAKDADCASLLAEAKEQGAPASRK